MQIIKPLSGPKFLGAVFVFVRNVEFISKQPCQFFVFTLLSLQFKCSVHPCILFCLLAFPPHPFPYFLISGYLLRTPDNSIFFFDFPSRFELSGVICLVPRRLSLDENVRAKEGGKDSVLFQWSLAAHHQSLAITLRKTKCLRRRLGSYDQHQNRKNSGYFSRKSPQALASKPLKLEIHTSSWSVTSEKRCRSREWTIFKNYSTLNYEFYNLTLFKFTKKLPSEFKTY